MSSTDFIIKARPESDFEQELAGEHLPEEVNWKRVTHGQTGTDNVLAVSSISDIGKYSKGYYQCLFSGGMHSLNVLMHTPQPYVRGNIDIHKTALDELMQHGESPRLFVGCSSSDKMYPSGSKQECEDNTLWLAEEYSTHTGIDPQVIWLFDTVADTNPKHIILSQRSEALTIFCGESNALTDDMVTAGTNYLSQLARDNR